MKESIPVVMPSEAFTFKNRVNHAENLDLEKEYKMLEYKDKKFPLREWIMTAKLSHRIVYSKFFGDFILGVIIVAAVVVGLQTYPQFARAYFIFVCERIIFYIFVFELGLKIISQGLQPWKFFTGKQWKWNTFDFAVVVCSGLPLESESLQLLRVIRLMRLVKFFHHVRPLRLITEGLLGGLSSISYIVLLLLIIFYVYAIAGIYLFRENDPWHFKSIELSSMALLGFATLFNWGDVMYVNYYGCDKYPMGLYTNDPSLDQGRIGGTVFCATPRARPWLAVVYCVSFIFITAFCMLALFVGAVTLSMSEGMVQFELEKADKRKHITVDTKTAYNPLLDPRRWTSRADRRALGRLALAFNGLPVDRNEHDSFTPSQPLHGRQLYAHYYRVLSDRCADYCHRSSFRALITACILLTVLEAGMVADGDLTGTALTACEALVLVVQYVFAAECLLKIVSEEFTPWMYFTNGWNLFDLAITIGSFLDGSSNLILTLRIVRLFRVIRMMHSLPQLQVIVIALMDSASSISYASLLLFFFFYFFGVLGNILFGENDPWRFGRLHMALVTLFQIVTLDNWNDVLYTNMFGCDLYGYESYFPAHCTDPKPQVVLSVLYFSALVVLGSFVLLSLFIGVVSNCLEQATRRQKVDQAVEERVRVLVARCGLGEREVVLYRELFERLDADHEKYIELNELLSGFRYAKADFSDAAMLAFWQRASDGVRGYLDFSEFLRAMLLLRGDKAGAVPSFADISEACDDHLDPNKKGLVGGRGAAADRRAKLSRLFENLLKQNLRRRRDSKIGDVRGKGEGEGAGRASGPEDQRANGEGSSGGQRLAGRSGSQKSSQRRSSDAPIA